MKKRKPLTPVPVRWSFSHKLGVTEFYRSDSKRTFKRTDYPNEMAAREFCNYLNTRT